MTGRSVSHRAEYCRIELNYVAQDPAAEEPVPAPAIIHDGRLNNLPGWGECGFELLEHTSRVHDWDDADEISALHYQEMADLATQLTGCDHALVGGHILRNPQQAALHADLAPITFVHSDFAESYGDLMIDYYGGEDPEAVLGLRRAGIDSDTVRKARRMLILQFWRNVGPVEMDLPLAFCDCRSVPASDLRVLPVSDYAGGGFDFDTLGIAAPDTDQDHVWYVFPRMNNAEVIAFRTYDSDRVDHGRPFWTPHSAFPDPHPGLPSRHSIELRATCLFL